MRYGIDKGFCLSYHELSYRRKLIQTIWVIAFSPLILLLSRLPSAPIYNLPFYLWGFLLTVVIGVIQAIYNFVKWKQESQEQSKNDW